MTPEKALQTLILRKEAAKLGVALLYLRIPLREITSLGRAVKSVHESASKGPMIENRIGNCIRFASTWYL